MGNRLSDISYHGFLGQNQGANLFYNPLHSVKQKAMISYNPIQVSDKEKAFNLN